jgi:glycosyltransferase involved in cell wall biosynthesis
VTRFVVVDATPYGPEPSGARRRAVEMLRRLPARTAPAVLEVHWARDGGGPPADLVAPGLVHATVDVSSRGGVRRWLARGRDLRRRHREAPFTHLLVDHGPLVVPDRVANVVTVHDLRFLHGWAGAARAWYGRRRYGDLLRRAAAVVAVSAAVAEELSVAYGLRDVVVAPNAPSPALRAPDPAVRRATAERLGVTGPYVLAVGRDEPRKALRAAVAAARAAGLPLVVAGAAGFSEPGVACVGEVPDGDLAALYAGAAWTLVPSLYEGYSLPVAESLACGTPVVASDVAAHRALAADGARGVVLVPPPVAGTYDWSPAAEVLRGPRPADVAPPATTWEASRRHSPSTMCRRVPTPCWSMWSTRRSNSRT